MLRLTSQPDSFFSTETLQHIYNKSDFLSLISLSMTCKELMVATYPMLTHKTLEAYTLYTAKEYTFTKYVKKHFISELFNISKTVAKIGFIVWLLKSAKGHRALVPTGCPTREIKRWSEDAGKFFTYKVPDHPEYETSKNWEFSAIISCLFFTYRSLTSTSNNNLDAALPFNVSYFSREFFPEYVNWKYIKTHKERTFEVIDNQGHKFDFKEIKLYILLQQNKNPGQPVICPKSHHAIELDTLYFDKNSFDVKRAERKIAKYQHALIPSPALKAGRAITTSLISIKENTSWSISLIQSLVSTIKDLGISLLKVSYSQMPSLSLIRK